MEICYFCHLPLVEGDTDEHHPFPVRFTKTKKGITVKVHRSCHVAFNHKVDRDGRLSYSEYMKRMKRMNFGNGIFAGLKLTSD